MEGRRLFCSVHVNGVKPKYFKVLNARETEELYN